MSAIATPFVPAGTTTPPPANTGPKPWKWTREQYYKLGELGFFDGKRVELIRGEIADTVASPADIEEEMRHLFDVVGR